MPRFLFTTALVTALAGAVQAQDRSQVKPLSPDQKQLVSRLTTEWKGLFRSISTLDMQWNSSGTWAFQPGVLHSNQYHFWRDARRHRLDTTFHSSQTSPQHTKISISWHDGAYFKDLDVMRSGFARMTARRKARQEDNPYGIPIPLVDIFLWATSSKTPYTLEAFGKDAIWQQLAPRVEGVKKGIWQGKNGWWLEIASEKNGGRAPQTRRVFIDSTTFLPLFVRGRYQLTTQNAASVTSYSVQIIKTQSFSAGRSLHFLPLDFVSRVWMRDLKTGKRTSEIETTRATAPATINKLLSPQVWQVDVPAKTLVYFAPSIATKMTDERAFTFEPGGGSLWSQSQREKRRDSDNLKRLRALPSIYDEKADGEAQIAAALPLAAVQHKNVLLQFGAYWCSPCHVLHDLLQADSTLSPLVKDNYISVSIDLNNGHNDAVSKRLMGGEQGGLPFIVILDAAGKRLAAPPTEYFTPKVGNNDFDIKKLAAFLNRWKPQ